MKTESLDELQDAADTLKRFLSVHGRTLPELTASELGDALGTIIRILERHGWVDCRTKTDGDS